ncbi:MAG: DUF2294 domain-containing protein [Candidatus Abyssobacteria bacterium SURF_5]|uniref:DUF2294 domain-containing protein n=1 Tax=Abyssobacteria bacterium (strain SURF_5) TaxID=2093360 RepID=A0A3A4NHW6_ABYX5|nr:MAG: DUF2294 domain-containing protein [Candidatus Abyssubacteria bacterium SURF_5]
MRKTRGQMEEEICKAIMKFEKDYMGRGPLETRTHIIEDIVLIRLKKVLTQAELNLAKSEGDSRGRELIKQIRIELLEKGRSLLETSIQSITQRVVVSLHTDISTKTGERIIIFTLDGHPAFDGSD